MKVTDFEMFLDRLANGNPEEKEDAKRELLRENERLRRVMKTFGVPDWLLDDQEPTNHVLVVMKGEESGR